jgi:hypothetical protein
MPLLGQKKYRLGEEVRGLGRVMMRASGVVSLGRMKSLGVSVGVGLVEVIVPTGGTI